MATTTYESDFPTGLMQPNIKEERHGDDVELIAAANDYNRHDVEILRIQEVIGLQTSVPAGSIMERLEVLEDTSGLAPHDYVGSAHTGLGDNIPVTPGVGGHSTVAAHMSDSAIHQSGALTHPYVGSEHTGVGDGIPITPDIDGNTTISGHVNDAALHIGGSLFGDKIPFHSDAADPNYKFAQWFLEWMGIWDALSGGGAHTPSLIELIKALWQNKYELEIMFDPLFLYPGTYTPVGGYFGYTSDREITFWAGLPPYTDWIGAACNLNVRPYPINTVYAGGIQQEGLVTIASGIPLEFFTDPALSPDPSGAYEISLFRRNPFVSYMQPSGVAPGTGVVMPGSWTPPSGQQPPPVVGSGIPGVPGAPIDDLAPLGSLVIGPDFLPIPTDGGGLELYGGPVKASYPLLDPYGPILGMTTIKGVDLSAGSGVATAGTIPLSQGLWQISAQVTPGWRAPGVFTLLSIDMGARATALPESGALADPLWVHYPIGDPSDTLAYQEIATIPLFIVEANEYMNLQVQIWVNAAPGEGWNLYVLSLMKQLIDKIR